MGYSRSWRQTCWNGIVELLASQNLDHLARGIRIDSLSFGNRLQKDQQAARRGRVVHSLLVGFVVFYPAPHIHAVCMQRGDRGANVVNAEFLDQEIGSEITAHGD